MDKNRKIINIINFLRGTEPRCEMDLVTPVKETIKILKNLQLPSTFLIQYDALENEEMMGLVCKTDGLFEKGGWLEIVQPMAQRVGIEWRGEYSWDYHANVDFTIGYPVEERFALVDEYMRKFREVFGCYPESVGSWVIDAKTIAYLKYRYDIKAVCICRDQYGTDGYNFWGGYYNHGYYPSKNNMLCPAQSEDQQISLPVFRMLGSDPIHQYDAGLVQNGIIDPSSWQCVITLEPTSKGGGNNDWVNWYLEENYNPEPISFSYSQAGQENSFGWDRVEKSLNYQYSQISEMNNNGALTAEHLCDTGKWFSENYRMSPVCSLPFLSDWSSQDYKTVWFYSKFYRINFLYCEGKLWIRDFHLFDENYPERYLFNTEKTFCSHFDNLPVIDGYRFSKKGIRAGGYFFDKDGKEMLFDGLKYENINETSARISSGKISVLLCEESLSIIASEGFYINLIACREPLNANIAPDGSLLMKHNSYEYSLKPVSGCFTENGNEYILKSENKKIEFNW